MRRRVISFGVIKGLIYRVHKYPILTSTNESETQFSFPTKDQYDLVVNKYTGMPIHPEIIPYLDGKHHYDEICTALECSPQELDEQLGCVEQQQQQQQFDDNNQAVENENHIVRTVDESASEDKQSEGQPQWNVHLLYI